MSSELSLPLPLDPLPPPEADEKRLWIGNLDAKLTEYHLVKVLQTYGKIKKFDFLFHKHGPLKGQPRGYSFVTYNTKQEAQTALNSLNGKVLLKRALSVKWAHTVSIDDAPAKKVAPQVLNVDSQNIKNVHSQINAIESKLKTMAEQDDDLEFCLSSTPLTRKKKNPIMTEKHSSNNRHHEKDSPYSKIHHRNYTSKTSRR